MHSYVLLDWLTIANSGMAITTYRKSASYRKKQAKWTSDWRKRKMESDPDYAKKHRAKVVVAVAKWKKKQYSTNIQFRRKCRFYATFHHMFRSLVRIKRGESFALTGCTLTELADHIEKQWTPGMTWDNYAKTWVIDHIDGIGMFDLTKEGQVFACWHFTNLRPMPLSAHLKKRDGLVLRDSLVKG